MFNDLRTHYMTPRNWLGVTLIFLFLPVNVPLWDTAFDLISLNLSAVAVVPIFFLSGILILFFPAREKQASEGFASNEEE
ncbi:MAG: hypothetical protein QF831_02590 [Candidatus Thalassarchaeaceae archaeon]|nr:hypothetical protein [Candidatus Thalassarchaeaceae archaeon]